MEKRGDTGRAMEERGVRRRRVLLLTGSANTLINQGKRIRATVQRESNNSIQYPNLSNCFSCHSHNSSCLTSALLAALPASLPTGT